MTCGRCIRAVTPEIIAHQGMCGVGVDRAAATALSPASRYSAGLATAGYELVS
jgi:hypothetical protein